MKVPNKKIQVRKNIYIKIWVTIITHNYFGYIAIVNCATLKSLDLLVSLLGILLAHCSGQSFIVWSDLVEIADIVKVFMLNKSYCVGHVD